MPQTRTRPKFRRRLRPRRAVATAAVSCALSLLLVTTAHADSAVVGADRDNTIYSESTFSNGLGQHFHAGANSQGNVRRALIHFDVASAVPAGATIDNVTLTLHVSQGHDNFDIFVHRLLSDWGEGTSDAPGGEGSGTTATPGDATWMHTFYDDQFWTNPGGDFAPTVSAATNIVGTGFFDWSGSQLTADAQSWLDNPAANYGWMLRGEEDLLASSQRFDSRHNPTADFRPVLTVEYTPIPSPAAIGLLGIAGCALRRRRRTR